MRLNEAEKDGTRVPCNGYVPTVIIIIRRVTLQWQCRPAGMKDENVREYKIYMVK